MFPQFYSTIKLFFLLLNAHLQQEAIKHVNQAAETLLSESHPCQIVQPYELAGRFHSAPICIDDGSTDNSLSVLRSLEQEDKRVVVLEQKNSGQGIARNYGLTQAKHEWIMYADSDDFFELNAVEFVSQAFEQNPDLIVFSAKVFGDAEESEKESVERYYTVEKSGLNLLTNNERSKFKISPWGKVFKRSIIEKFDIKFPKYSHQDGPFCFFYLTQAKDVFYFNERLYNYLVRKDSTMGLTRSGDYQKAIDHLYNVEVLYDMLIKHNVAEANIEVFTMYFYRMYVQTFRYLSSKNKRRAFKLARKLLSKFKSGVDMSRYNHKGFLNEIAKGSNLDQEITYLFQIIPIIKVIIQKDKRKYLLFGILPIYKIRFRPNKSKHYIFGFLPFLKFAKK